MNVQAVPALPALSLPVTVTVVGESVLNGVPQAWLYVKVTGPPLLSSGLAGGQLMIVDWPSTSGTVMSGGQVNTGGVVSGTPERC